VKGLFIGLVGTITLNDHFLEPITIEGVSMAPTLSPSFNETGAKDVLLMQKWRPTANLQRGDVVMVTLDYRRRPKEGKEGMSKGGMVWDAIGEQKEFGVGKRRWRVPLGHVWVEGDNASMSKDSNTYGPVSFGGPGRCEFNLLTWCCARSRSH
jgi:inner membrane protease subunit 2